MSETGTLRAASWPLAMRASWPASAPNRAPVQARIAASASGVPPSPKNCGKTEVHLGPGGRQLVRGPVPADDDGSASPDRYAEMVREDRTLRLTGYEVYRFGVKN